MKKETVQRIFTVGSEWAYFKIYAGAYMADGLLVREIMPLAARLMRESTADCWFFIRYADPERHLRVRFHLTDRNKLGYVISLVYERLDRYVQERTVQKIQMDTYVREIERYGREHMECAERLFCTDSRCVTGLLKVLPDERMRSMAAFRLGDAILTAFGMDMMAKRDFTGTCAEAFKREFGFTGANAKVFNREYRVWQKPVRDSVECADAGMAEIGRVIEKHYRCGRTGKIVSELLSKRSDVTREEFLRSYLHMTMNRLFNSDNRRHEMVVYEYLHRYYKSAIARGASCEEG